MRKAGLIFILLLVLVLSLTGCGKNDQATVQPDNDKQQTEQVENVDTDGSKDIKEDEPANRVGDAEEEKEEENRIREPEQLVDPDKPTGEREEEELEGNEKVNLKTAPFSGKLMNRFSLPRPVMVTIENSPAARPQAGLEDASIIYEFLAEGGITRFLALYYEKFPKKIGPVRSTRPYFIEKAIEYDALLIHAGASPLGWHMLANRDIDHVDQIRIQKYFWRNSSRRAPHNLYTGADSFKDYFSKQNPVEIKKRFPSRMVSFVDESQANMTEEINIKYWGGYTVDYKYNRQRGNYLRFINGVPHLTESGKKLYAHNIFIQYVDTKVKDDAGRLEMKLEGSNKALLFKDGLVFQGQWVKEKDQPTHFLDGRGNKMTINPGQTWIQVVPTKTKIRY